MGYRMTALNRGTILNGLLVLFIACQIGACSKTPDGAAASAQAKTTAEQAASQQNSARPEQHAEAADSVDQKLEAYIGCYNRVDESAHRSINRYSSWVKDMKAGPSGKEKIVYGLYQINSESIASCKQAFASAAQAKPALALDAAGTAYIDALGALGKIVEEAYPYYDRENYKDDGFAKGKQLHTQLVAQISAFQTASDTFSNEIEKENDKRLEAQMNKLEKEQGRKLPYLEMASMHLAKQLVRLIEADTFPADQAGTSLAAFEKIADETMAFAVANKAALPTSWSSFESSAEGFRKAAKERVRRIRDNVAYSEGEKMMLKPGSAWMVEGSQEKLIKAYNAMVEASNRLN